MRNKLHKRLLTSALRDEIKSNKIKLYILFFLYTCLIFAYLPLVIAIIINIVLLILCETYSALMTWTIYLFYKTLKHHNYKVLEFNVDDITLERNDKGFTLDIKI